MIFGKDFGQLFSQNPLEKRVIILEDTNVKQIIWEEITAKGIDNTVENFNGKTTVDTTIWDSSPYNSEAKKIDSGGNYTGEEIFTSSGTHIKSIIDTNGDYLLSGIPNPALYPRYSIVYVRKGTAKEFGEEKIPSGQIIEVIENPSIVRDVENKEVRPRVAGDNLNMKTGGFKDSNVTTAVKLGDTNNTSYQTENKTILGSTNENNLNRKAFQGTRIISGCEVSTNIDNTFNVNSGVYEIVNSYTDPLNPTFTKINFAGVNNVALTYLNVTAVTFLSLDINGNVLQSLNLTNSQEERDKCPTGGISHPNGNIVNSATFGNYDYDGGLSWADLASCLGSRINCGGNDFSANGTNLSIDKSLGVMLGAGINFKNNKKLIHNKDLPAQTAPTFYMTKRNLSSASTFTLVSEIPTDKYEPTTGALVDIPTGKFVNIRINIAPEFGTNGLILVQYGQFLYDSLKKAVDSKEQEDFVIARELTSVHTRSILSVQQGTTDLSNPRKAKFSNLGIFGAKNFSKTKSYSRFGSAIKVIDGMSNERPSIIYVLDGGVIYADVEAEGGGDIIYTFGELEYVLNCTTGSGVDGRARIPLTAGLSSKEPTRNYITVIPTSGTSAILQASTIYPSGEFGWVCDVTIPDITTFITIPVYSSQRTSDNKSHDGRGALSYEREKIRSLGATWKAGVDPTITITDLTPDTLDISTTQGQVFQMHLGNMPALDSTTDGILILNKFEDNWHYTTALNTIQEDLNGDTLNNRVFNFVHVGIKSSADGVEFSKFAILLPNGSYLYTQLSSALNDDDNTAIYSVPSEIGQTAFLIARYTLKYKNGVWNNVRFDETGEYFEDLRGQSLGGRSGGGGGGGATTFLGLTDTPGSYTSQALKIPQVNAGETVLEFTDSLTLAGLTIVNPINEFSTDGTLAGDSDLAVPTEKAVKLYIDTGLNLKANDSEVVHLTGDETIEGIKTFVDQPSFHAYNSVSRLNVIGGSLVYQVPFDVEEEDVGGNFDPSTGVFTAPITGKYTFSYLVYTKNFVNNNLYYFTILATSAQDYPGREENAYANQSGAGNLGIPVTVTEVFLNLGDTVSIEVFCDGNPSIALSGGIALSYFRGRLE